MSHNEITDDQERQGVLCDSFNKGLNNNVTSIKYGRKNKKAYYVDISLLDKIKDPTNNDTNEVFNIVEYISGQLFALGNENFKKLKFFRDIYSKLELEIMKLSIIMLANKVGKHNIHHDSYCPLCYDGSECIDINITDENLENCSIRNIDKLETTDLIQNISFILDELRMRFEQFFNKELEGNYGLKECKSKPKDFPYIIFR